MQVSFSALTTGQRDAVAILEIGDTIQITKSFTSGTPASITEELAIEGLEHSIDPRTGHKMRIYTSPTSLVYELILDDAVFGKLDSSNVVGV